jgi:hypothetical protein
MAMPFPSALSYSKYDLESAESGPVGNVLKRQMLRPDLVSTELEAEVGPCDIFGGPW